MRRAIGHALHEMILHTAKAAVSPRFGVFAARINRLGRMMSAEFLTTAEAARRLGISRPTLYHWLGLSDHGLLVIRGQMVTIHYLQSGRNGQGKILIEPPEIERLKDILRVRPQTTVLRRPPIKPQQFPGITVPLGRPD